VVGKHAGYPFYTIGQRKGIVALGKPYYVTEIRPDTNTIVIGPEEALFHSRFRVRGLNLVKYAELPAEGLPVMAKIRYNTPAAPAYVRQIDAHTVEVQFSQPEKAIAPGQAAVFYEDDDVVGGGWIHTVLPNATA
jgi:tRNA-specific 2-thiouridylase